MPRSTCLLIAFVLVAGCSAEKAADPVVEPGALNTDPDGVYEFGDEEWIAASNGDEPYAAADVWTNSLNERMWVEATATLTGGQTAQSQCERQFEEYLEFSTGTMGFAPEPVQGVPGWWWYAITVPSFSGMLYEGCFVDAPRGLSTEISREGGDIGRLRAATILSTLKLL
jgi:hypothetical protein